MKLHRLLIVLSLTLGACAASPPGPEETATCLQKLEVKVGGKVIAESAPNPFHGFPNPEVSLQGEKFKISLNTEESGLIELSGLEGKPLQVGTLDGSQFQLTLSYSPNYKQCRYDRQDSKLIILEKASDKVSGCFYGKFDCDGQVVEVATPFSERMGSR